ncbi:MAG: SIMPL domain-containing protein [Aestuariivirga sp.]
MFRSLAAGTIVAAYLAATPAIAQEAKIVRSISMSGHGEVMIAPDMANISIGVVSQAATAREAQTANNQTMSQIMAALKAAGIAEKDIQTQNYTVQPRYDYTNNTQPPRLVGYDVSNTVMIAARDLSKLGEVLDATVTAGSNMINGISFGVAKPEAARDEARKLAAADATRKARLYAEASAVKLGKVISISEGGGYSPPVPVQAKAMRMEAADGAVPIAQGEQVIAIDVNIAWEIE